MFSRYFIERPILSNVIALVIVLIGAVCLVRLPVAQYPNVTPPTVSVTTRYPGASARVIMDTIALPIEQQVNGVPGMIYMQSTSASDGAYSLIVTFEIGTDMAQVLVQNRVASALAQLPKAVQIQGVTTQKQSTAVLMFLALTSPDKRFDSLFLANYGVINLQNELARLPGVGNVTVYGAGQYAMRVWMNPNLLQSFGLTPEDVVKAIQQQSQEVTAGVIGMPPAPKGQNFQYTVNVAGRVPFDTTVFVQASIKEVYITLIEAGVLVLIVILVFLQDWRATLVPATTVPVTIIGAFAAMAALGFTVNLSTLFALVLVIGIVVDDAIVIVEGVARHIEGGMPRREAAVKAMGELFGPIIGITLVLMSVFLPAAFLPGLTGQLYQQFALVIAATALISAINAVTLKPTQCALWLRPAAPPERRNLFYRIFNRVYDAAERGYTALIRRMVHHSAIVALLGVALIGVAFFGLARVPTAFIPLEDQGYLIVNAQLPDAASLERTQRVMEKVTNVAKGIAGVDQVVAISGISVLDNSASLPNAGVAYVVLKNWDERYKAKGQDLISLFKTLRAALQHEILEANTTVIPPPPIQGIGNSGGFTMEVELRDGSSDFAKLQGVVTGIVNDAKSQSAVQTVFSPFRASAPQLEAIVDRNKAETLGVTVGQVFQSLGSYIGSTYVGQINKFGRVFQVYVQSESQFRTTPATSPGSRSKRPTPDGASWNARSGPEGYRPSPHHAL